MQDKSVEILHELLDPNGNPERLLVQWEPFEPIMNEPMFRYLRGNRARGVTSRDRFGTLILWPEDSPGAMPHITDDDKVCPDVTEWEKYVHFPDLDAVAAEPGAWDEARALQDKIHAEGKLSSVHFGTGTFEQAHFLMGIEDTLCNFFEEPEAMKELIDAIAAWRYHYVELVIEYLHPDMFCSHDDWGTHDNLFFPPDTWREFFKENYRKMYGLMKDNGVIAMHHADSVCEPIVTEMAEIGVDIWQGVLPTNDIPKMQEALKSSTLGGHMVLMGGIDEVIDTETSSEEEIRAEVRRALEAYAPGGLYIPALTPGLKNGALYPRILPFVDDEIVKFNKEMYGA